MQNVAHHDRVISETEQSILSIRSEVDSIGAILNAKRPSVTQQKHYAKPLKYQQQQKDGTASRRHASMMEIREDDDKNTDERTTNPTPPPPVQ